MRIGRDLLVVFLFVLGLAACGIDEIFYLPQAPEPNNSTISFSEIDLPPINLADFYYAQNYKIFYRIYLSLLALESITNLSEINQTLSSDYNYFQTYTNPDNSEVIRATTFSGRNYYELNYNVGNDGSTGQVISNLLPNNISSSTNISKKIRIEFPLTDIYPYITIDGGQPFNLFRSNIGTSGGSFTPEPNRYFLGASELRDNSKAGPRIDNQDNIINRDIAPQSGNSGISEIAYVSMYIVIAGGNPIDFTTVFGKPAHLGIFRLTNVN